MRLNLPTRTATRFDGEDATYNYVGKAPVGSSTSTACWQIFRLTNSATASIIIEWADGDDLFNNVWNDRATLSYS